jgi:hypothetical protein
MTSFAGWLKVTIDNKPWWAIIVAAALGAMGSEVIKNAPSAYSWIRSFFPIEPTIHIFVRSKGSNSPIEGARVAIMDTMTLKPIGILGSTGNEAWGSIWH